MSKFTNPLNNISVASPCSQDWDQMIGTERKRFCGDCKLNVYNLSGMTKQEAENLLMNSEGRLCVRFYRRADGSVLTKDCPVGWQAVKQRMSKTATAAASLVIAALGSIGLANYFARTNEPQVMGTMTPYIEKPLTGEISFEKSDVDIEAPKEPIATMGVISVTPRKDYSQVVGRIAPPKTVQKKTNQK